MLSTSSSHIAAFEHYATASKLSRNAVQHNQEPYLGDQQEKGIHFAKISTISCKPLLNHPLCRIKCVKNLSQITHELDRNIICNRIDFKENKHESSQSSKAATERRFTSWQYMHSFPLNGTINPFFVSIFEFIQFDQLCVLYNPKNTIYFENSWQCHPPL